MRWERKQNKGNIREKKRTVDSAKFESYDEITRRRSERKGDRGALGIGQGVRGWKGRRKKKLAVQASFSIPRTSGTYAYE